MVKTRALRDAYAEELIELGKKDERIVVLDADLAGSTRTAKFGKVFPDRFFNMGIAEANMINTATGLASFGKIAFVSTFAMFATGRVWEQIRNTAVYSGYNVNIVATHAGVTVGADGASHQIIEDISIIRTIPTMKVFAPADYYETKQIIRTVAYIDGATYTRLTRPDLPVIYEDSDYEFKIGKFHILKSGNDATLFAHGVTLYNCLKAAEILEKKNIFVSVVNCSSIKPPDIETTIMLAQKTKLLFAVEDHSIIGGLGSTISEILTQYYPVKLIRLGIPDVFGFSGKPDELLEHFGLSAEKIANTVEYELGKLF
ncbi:MAG TPA: transketolase family protein [bacterium]|nr:transketolase family protein [bacterium]HOL48046.1 transketolase family protein [bacterium]HPQ19762.1 transketolase family protein [bacterium]